MRFIKHLSLTLMGTLSTLAGLTGLISMMARHTLFVQAQAAQPGWWDYALMTSFITLFVIGFGLLVMTGPQLPEEEDQRTI